jgi:hypothetical protein
MERIDIHSPANFDPAQYSYVGAIYRGNATSDITCEIVDAYLSDNELSQEELAELAKNSSFNGNYKQKDTCDHCGAHFNYGALYRHTNGDVIVVGWECSAKRFGCNSRLDYDMNRLHKAIEAAREQAKKKEQAEAFLSTKPGLKAILDGNHAILADLKVNLYKWGSLTDKQVAFAAKLDREMKQRSDQVTAEENLPQSPVVEGRIQVSGIILGFKEVEVPKYSYYSSGTAWKMILRDDRGFKLYGNMPSAINMADRGKHVAFKATVQKSNDNRFFGFFKRPVKIEVNEAAVV